MTVPTGRSEKTGASDPWDSVSLDDLLTRRVETDLTSRLRAKKSKRRAEAYVPPVKCHDVAAWYRAGASALVVMLALKRLEAMTTERPMTLGWDFEALFGMHPKTRNRAIRALEAAGYLKVDWHKGRLPRIWVIDLPGDAAAAA